MNKFSKKKVLRVKRKLRIRAKLSGTGTVPRLSVFRSNSNLTVQAVNDATHTTLFSVIVKGKNSEAAENAGKLIAGKAKDKKVSAFVFDRGGYKYHGTVKVLADTIRKEGITI